jgi:hypothetical protein
LASCSCFSSSAAFFFAVCETHLPKAFFLPPNILRKFSAPALFLSALQYFAAFLVSVFEGAWSPSATAPAGMARAAARAPPTISFFITLPP